MHTVKDDLCLAGTTWKCWLIKYGWNKAKMLRSLLLSFEGMAWHDGYLTVLISMFISLNFYLLWQNRQIDRTCVWTCMTVLFRRKRQFSEEMLHYARARCVLTAWSLSLSLSLSLSVSTLFSSSFSTLYFSLSSSLLAA